MIEAALGERRGERTDLPANAGTLAAGETADIAAKKSGFGSGDTYARAKKVVASGAPELVAAMDEGTVSVSAARPRPQVSSHGSRSTKAMILSASWCL